MKIAIIGAGISGLTAAYDLQKAGHAVVVYERESQPGGLAGGFKQAKWDWSLEKYYHHWFRTDKPILTLIDELGLSENVIFKQPKTVVFHDGNFYPLDSVIAVLKFPGFSFLNKMRFGFITAYLKYVSSWEHLEKHTAAAWIERYYGKDLYDIFFKPLLVGKFDQYYKDVTMAWFWARFKVRSTRLGTYRGGFQAFLNHFSKILDQNGVRFVFNTNVTRILTAADETLQIEIDWGEPEHFDQVLNTLSPQLLPNLIPSLPESYLEKVRRLKSTGAVVVIYSLKHQLSSEGYYWYNMPKSTGFPFLALVEHTNFVKSKYFNNEHIIYCGDYLESSHPYFSKSDNELAELYLSAFKKINSLFTEEWVNQYWVYRTPFAQPVPVVNHSQNLLEIETPIKGLFLASMSQVYPWDRGTNFAVSFAHQAVRVMKNAL